MTNCTNRKLSKFASKTTRIETKNRRKTVKWFREIYKKTLLESIDEATFGTLVHEILVGSVDITTSKQH